jgi:hypothetical protein
LLESVIDYAGLFPPARLPLDAAIRNYARYRQEPESWMLGRFVLPAVRLPELDPYVGELFASGPPLAVAALGSGGDSIDAWKAGIDADARAAAACRQHHGDRVRIDVLETRLPDAALATTRGLAGCVQAASSALGPTVALFFEGPREGKHLHALSEQGAGFKLRCGGLTAAAFPTAEQVAGLIHACHKMSVRMKLTAGLHHPLPRFDPGVQATMHGFINVLVAGVLARAGAEELLLIDVLRDADPASFAFDGGLTWKGWRASPAEKGYRALAAIAAARRHGILSFGSCSFDEPRDDLRVLGWL